MALALILRNVPKTQAGAIQQNLLKTTSVTLTRDLSFENKCHPLNRNANLKLIPHNQLIVAPQMRFMSADHSKLWPIEKALSASLIVLVPAAIAMPNLLFDTALSVAAVAHFHWGLEACVVDYVRPIVVGNILPKLTMGLLYLISALTLGGLLYHNINDIGVGRSIRKFWALKGGKKEVQQK